MVQSPLRANAPGSGVTARQSDPCVVEVVLDDENGDGDQPPAGDEDGDQPTDGGRGVGALLAIGAVVLALLAGGGLGGQ